MDRRNGIARCQRHELLALPGQERVGGDEERISMQLDQGGESRVDLAVAASFQDMELQALRTRCSRFPKVDIAARRGSGH